MLEPRSSISFRLPGGQGAVLLTKHATLCEDVQQEGTFEEYTKKHYDSWETFARKRGHNKDVKPFLVTGVSMTRDFAMMSYSDDGDSLRAEFKISAPEVTPPWGMWRKPGAVHSTCGPQPRHPPRATRTVNSVSSGNIHTAAVSDEYNQCVFVRYYTVRKRLGIPRVIKAAAGPHNMGPGNNDDPRSSLEAQSNSGSGLNNVLSPFDDHGDDNGSSVTSADFGSDIVIHNTPAVRPPTLLIRAVLIDPLQDRRDDFDKIADYVLQESLQ